MPQATLIRGIEIELNVGTDATPDWQRIEGINNVAHTPQTNRADTRTFDDEGWMAHLVAARGNQLTFGGLKQLDEDTGDRPPGQEAVEDWATEIGVASLKQFRILDQSGALLTPFPFWASCEATLLGGGNDDADNWGFTVETSGPPISS